MNQISNDVLEVKECILEYGENIRLLKLAEKRKNSNMTLFEEFVAEEGYSIEELKKLSESVEVE
jgi:nucleoid-associated protein YejK